MKRLTLSFLTIFFCLSVLPLSAQNAKLSFQGVLRDSDGRAVDDGSYSLTFKFYDAEVNGSQVGSDVIKSVDVENGIYSVILDATDLAGLGFDQDYYLSTSYNGVEFPNRMPLTASPYALSLLGTSNIFPSAGSVGVGTTTPSSPLDVASHAVIGNITPGSEGTAQAASTHSGNGFLTTPWLYTNVIEAQNERDAQSTLIAVGDEGNYSAGDEIHFVTNGVSRMHVASNGRIGIGVDSPVSTLHVNSTDTGNPFRFNNNTLTDGQSIGLELGKENTTDNMGEIRYWHESDGNSSNRLSIGLWGDPETMVVTADSRVGIGTENPQAKLHVKGTVQNFSNGPDADSYFYGGGPNVVDGGNTDIVAYFEGWTMIKGGLVCALSPSASDRRAKTIIGNSDSASDLATLQTIEITDFKWIDKSITGDKVTKKVIAQQVKEVYPEAISYTKDVIPSVYETANQIDHNPATGTLTLTMPTAHDLTPGDEVKLYTDTDELTRVEVLAVASDTEFTVKCDEAPEHVFVYGKWVDDFHVVDYDAISMLNVSATQELARQVEELQNRVTALETVNARLRAENTELDQLKAEMQQIKALLTGQTESTVKQANLH